MEVLNDRITDIQIVYFKMDQSPTPALHFIDLRFYSTTISK
jgi:hypothetical protein